MASPLSVVRDAMQSCLAPSPDDLSLADFLLSVAASQFLSDRGDPLWGWVIGPPGSMKTEVLRAFDDHPTTYFLSSLTPQSLISGFERPDGDDPSLLPQFADKLVIIKEFTSIIQLPDAHVRQIFGDLRGIYDGSHSKGFGTVGRRAYKSRFSLLAAVTPVIDKFTLLHTNLGERFLSFRVGRGSMTSPAERTRVARHVWDAADTKTTWRAAFRGAVHNALTRFSAGADLPIILPDDRDMLIDLADLLAILRSLPIDASEPVEPELASRTVQQLKHLVAGRCIADGRTTVNADDIDLARRVSFDTLPTLATTALRYLYRHQPRGSREYLDARHVSRVTHVPVAFIYRMIAQYAYCGFAHGKSSLVRLSDDFITRLEHTRIFSAAKDNGGVEDCLRDTPCRPSMYDTEDALP